MLGLRANGDLYSNTGVKAVLLPSITGLTGRMFIDRIRDKRYDQYRFSIGG